MVPYHHSAGEVMVKLQNAPKDESGVQSCSLALVGMHSAWNPASTHNTIHGPCMITYYRYPDGGVDAVVRNVVKV